MAMSSTEPVTAAVAWPPKAKVFGVGISITDYAQAAEAIVAAGAAQRPAVVSCHAVHALMTAADDPELRDRVNAFEIVTADGQPVRWAMNLLHRAGMRERVYGPQLMLEVCRRAAEQGVAIYLYGGSPAVAEELPKRLAAQFPDLRIAGWESPPYRDLTEEEDAALVERIAASGAGIVFIGLGCPKQDFFAARHRDRLPAVQVCVGAAFDFHAGAKPMAPRWMQRSGLEWLYRLACEPRRLWKRYLATNSRFLWRLGIAWLGGKK